MIRIHQVLACLSRQPAGRVFRPGRSGRAGGARRGSARRPPRSVGRGRQNRSSRAPGAPARPAPPDPTLSRPGGQFGEGCGQDPLRPSPLPSLGPARDSGRLGADRQQALEAVEPARAPPGSAGHLGGDLEPDQGFQHSRRALDRAAQRLGQGGDAEQRRGGQRIDCRGQPADSTRPPARWSTRSRASRHSRSSVSSRSRPSAASRRTASRKRTVKPSGSDGPEPAGHRRR